MQLNAGVTRLLRMVGVKSLARNTVTEDSAYRQDLGVHQRGLWGRLFNQGSVSNKGGEMEVMAARDVVIQKPSVPSWIPLAATALAGLGIWKYLEQPAEPSTPPAAAQVDYDTRVTPGFGVPEYIDTSGANE